MAHALKFYFSNRFLYAHVQNVVSGKVMNRRCVAALSMFPIANANPRAQIAVAASTFEKTVRESLTNTADQAAARKLGAYIFACSYHPPTNVA